MEERSSGVLYRRCGVGLRVGQGWTPLGRVRILRGGLESYGETCFLSIITDGSEADTAIYEGSDAPGWHRYWFFLALRPCKAMSFRLFFMVLRTMLLTINSNPDALFAYEVA